MRRASFWKTSLIVGGLVLLAGISASIQGATDLATALFVVAGAEATVGVVMWALGRRRVRLEA